MKMGRGHTKKRRGSRILALTLAMLMIIGFAVSKTVTYAQGEDTTQATGASLLEETQGQQAENSPQAETKNVPPIETEKTIADGQTEAATDQINADAENLTGENLNAENLNGENLNSEEVASEEEADVMAAGLDVSDVSAGLLGADWTFGYVGFNEGYALDTAGNKLGLNVKKLYVTTYDQYVSASSQGARTAGAEIAYCFNFSKKWPHSYVNGYLYNSSGNLYQSGNYKAYSSYAQLANPTGAQFTQLADNEGYTGETLRKKIISIGLNGYPHDYSGYGQAAGLTDDEFRAVTQCAIWYITDYNYSSNGSYTVRLFGNAMTAKQKTVYAQLINNNLSDEIIDKATFLKLYQTTGVQYYSNTYGWQTDSSAEYSEQNLLSVGRINEQLPKQETAVSLQARKTVNGQDPGNHKFSFVLCDETGKVIQTKENGADGTITFEPLNLEMGEYTYYISEVQGTDANIVYDKSMYVVNVSVYEDNGAIVSDVSYRKLGSKNTDTDSVYYGYETQNYIGTGIRGLYTVPKTVMDKEIADRINNAHTAFSADEIAAIQNMSDVAYCFNATSAFPISIGGNNIYWSYGLNANLIPYDISTNVTAQEFADAADREKLQGEELKKAILSLGLNGYPSDFSGFGADAGLTDDQFRYVTQYAVWHFTDGYNIPSSATAAQKTVYNKLINTVLSDDILNHATFIDLFTPQVKPSDLGLTGTNNKYQHLLVVGAKMEETNEALFDNQTHPEEKEPSTYKLTIKKTVSGDFADVNETFTFQISLTDPNGSPLAGIYSGVTFGTDGTAEVSLKHNETLEIAGLPEGYGYTVTELGATDYQTWINSVQDTDKSIVATNVKADTELAYENQRNQIVPTGVDTNVFPYAWIFGLAAVGLVGFVIGQKRKAGDA